MVSNDHSDDESDELSIKSVITVRITDDGSVDIRHSHPLSRGQDMPGILKVLHEIEHTLQHASHDTKRLLGAG